MLLILGRISRCEIISTNLLLNYSLIIYSSRSHYVWWCFINVVCIISAFPKILKFSLLVYLVILLWLKLLRLLIQNNTHASINIWVKSSCWVHQSLITVRHQYCTRCGYRYWTSKKMMIATISLTIIPLLSWISHLIYNII